MAWGGAPMVLVKVDFVLVNVLVFVLVHVLVLMFVPFYALVLICACLYLLMLLFLSIVQFVLIDAPVLVNCLDNQLVYQLAWIKIKS